MFIKKVMVLQELFSNVRTWVSELQLLYSIHYDERHGRWPQAVWATATSIVNLGKAYVTQSWERNRVTTIQRGEYDINYALHGGLYKIRVYCQRGPRVQHHSFRILDEQGENITSVLIPYLGPMLDCHGIAYTPHMFGYKALYWTIFRNHSNGRRQYEYTLLTEENELFPSLQSHLTSFPDDDDPLVDDQPPFTTKSD